MGMVQVIDDTHVAHAFGAKRLDHGDQVLRAAEPAAMVIEGDLTALRGARLANRLEPGDLGRDAGSLFGVILGRARTALPHDPELRVNVMPTEQRECRLRLVVQDRREPPPLQGNPMLL